MQHSVKSFTGFSLEATDGEIGKVKELYFDDHSWTVRYLVVETGSWLSGRKVLISPASLLMPKWDEETFPVNLTRKQIENSPAVDTDRPVSRQEELKLYQHYSWPDYWNSGMYNGAMGMWGMPMPPVSDMEEQVKNSLNVPAESMDEDTHLRSTKELNGYSIDAADGKIGDVDDFLIDYRNWEISFLVVDTGNWLPGRKVLLSPAWINKISWKTSFVEVALTIEAVKNSPEFDRDQPVSDSYRDMLFTYYGKALPNTDRTHAVI